MCSGHDILLALGLIKSTSLIFVGTFCGIFSIKLITTQLFAETFVDNKRLLKEVEIVNEGLQKTVIERTMNLMEKTQEISSILDSLPEGILEADKNLKVLGNYSPGAGIGTVAPAGEIYRGRDRWIPIPFDRSDPSGPPQHVCILECCELE